MASGSGAVRVRSFPAGHVLSSFADFFVRGRGVELLVDYHLWEAWDCFIIDGCRAIEHVVEVFDQSLKDLLLVC